VSKLTNTPFIGQVLALSEITATTGFDAGDAEIGKIIYQREDNATAQTVTIRTNGGELEVSAKPDTVYHYNVASKVVVTKVHNASYHENGTVVGNLEVNEGRVVIESGASVSALVVEPKENATVEVAPNGGNVAAVVSTKAVGTDVIIPETLKPTVIDETKKNEMNQFAGGIGTEASPYLIETVEQLLKINDLYASVDNTAAFQNLSKYEGNPYYFKQISNIETSSIEGEKYVLRVFTGEYDGNGFTLTLKEHVNPSERHSFIQTIFGKIVLKNMEVNFENGAAYTLISINDFTTNNPQLVAELNGITVDSNSTVSLSSGIYGIFLE